MPTAPRPPHSAHPKPFRARQPAPAPPAPAVAAPSRRKALPRPPPRARRPAPARPPAPALSPPAPAHHFATPAPIRAAYGVTPLHAWRTRTPACQEGAVTR
ncbi:hypothetical protein GCM10009851_26660 [Herbiconiux moechotypicola]|uniref:Uncharacterized protein n=1 Tax=Herbiconiux moechotypicola TaxID=637393 RepID=A0ABP5QQQ8_9MICO